MEIRRGGNNPRKKATGLFPVALIDWLAHGFPFIGYFLKTATQSDISLGK